MDFKQLMNSEEYDFLSLVDDHNHDWTTLNDLFRIIVG